MDERVETIAVLDAVRDVLSNPDRWTREVMAQHRGDALSYDTSPGDPGANCWCLMGAIGKVLRADSGSEIKAHPAYCALAETLQLPQPFVKLRFNPLLHSSRNYVPIFNDHIATRHADVLALIDATIARLRSAP